MQDRTIRRSQKLQMIETWKQSGLSQKDFCAEHNITFSTFYYWYRIYKSSEKSTDGFLPLAVKDNTDESVNLTGNNGIRLQLPVSDSAVAFVKQLLLS